MLDLSETCDGVQELFEMCDACFDVCEGAQTLFGWCESTRISDKVRKDVRTLLKIREDAQSSGNTVQGQEGLRNWLCSLADCFC